MKQTLQIPSKITWVSTNIVVSAGDYLRFTAAGQWVDAKIETGPEGYDNIWMSPFTWMRRVPEARWFELVGCLDKRLNTAFRIGAGTTRIFPEGGRLFCFANDARGFYGNNHGEVTLTIERL